MFTYLKNLHKKYPVVIISRAMVFILSFSLIFAPSAGFAQGANLLNLPAPGMMVVTSPAFQPTIIAGMKIYPDDPLRFDFIIDTGDNHLEGEALKKESQKLINYFMAALTVPEDEMWVNLSPYEKDRIIADGLSQTEMGRDMLAQDYLLKQLTSSLMYPEDDFGKKFWDRVYKKAQDQYGTTDISVNTFNKIWIMPEDALVYVHDTNVFVVENHLTVMLEEDYLAMDFHQKSTARSRAPARGLSMDFHQKSTDRSFAPAKDETISVQTQIIRELLIPEIEKEINTGKNFANLRQMYNSMLLAAYYKKHFKESVVGHIYADQNKINGIDIEDKAVTEKIYKRYVEAFEKGVYNYVKEDIVAMEDQQADTATPYAPAEGDRLTRKTIPRKYFSGGARGHMGRFSETGISNSPLILLSDKRSFVRAAVQDELLGAGVKQAASPVLSDFDKLLNGLNGVIDIYSSKRQEDPLTTLIEKNRRGVLVRTMRASNTGRPEDHFVVLDTRADIAEVWDYFLDWTKVETVLSQMRTDETIQSKAHPLLKKDHRHELWDIAHNLKEELKKETWPRVQEILEEVTTDFSIAPLAADTNEAYRQGVKIGELMEKVLAELQRAWVAVEAANRAYETLRKAKVLSIARDIRSAVRAESFRTIKVAHPDEKTKMIHSLRDSGDPIDLDPAMQRRKDVLLDQLQDAIQPEELSGEHIEILDRFAGNQDIIDYFLSFLTDQISEAREEAQGFITATTYPTVREHYQKEDERIGRFLSGDYLETLSERLEVALQTILLETKNIQLRVNDVRRHLDAGLQKARKTNAAYKKLTAQILTDAGTADSPVGEQTQTLKRGGIDFNPNNVNLRELGDTIQIDFSTFDLEGFDLNTINGILPVIIHITPLPSIRPLLGLEPKREDQFNV